MGSVSEGLRELRGPELPVRLRDLERPPDVAYVLGELPVAPAVAIVGTRKPTAGGERFATELARSLASRGVVVLSGGARGIDAAAHRGALEARGVTVVVAPSSFDRPYPEEHRSLFDEIVRSRGGFFTAYAPGTAARRSHFFARNALLAALADAVVVVESRVRGGARNAAKAARRLGRPVLAVPGAPWNSRARGCLVELRLGARLLVDARDVLSAISMEIDAVEQGRARRSGAGREPRRSSGRVLENARTYPLDPEQRAVLAAIGRGAGHPDDICRETGLPPQRIQGLLLTLTLDGIVVSGPSGQVKLVSG